MEAEGVESNAKKKLEEEARKEVEVKLLKNIN